jgi:alkanesulfonate monooxygenase SsuD/methylene tetrahydromethanopterin reductase-like flavin-dependent oxidoreductase (luciferase family)
MSKPSLGWITQLVARYGVTDKTILNDNDLFIQKIKGKFDTLWFDDHFHKNDSAILETWTTLTYWAAQYPEFRFGTSVLCQSYRNPALLAKMATTLQLLTGGRLILGIGAGWKRDEYEAFNYPFPPTKERLEQLEDTANILKAMWSGSPATLEGKHYRIKNAFSLPLPDPPPELLIGGGGEKFTLRVVAEQADWMNVTHINPEDYSHKLEVLKSHCEKVGRDYQEITKSVWVYIFLSKEGKEHDAKIEDRYVLSGNPEKVLEGLRKYLDLGVQHLMLRFIDFPQTDGLDLFLEKVYPHL